MEDIIKEKEKLIDQILEKPSEESQEEKPNFEGLSYQERLKLEDQIAEKEHQKKMAEIEAKMVSSSKVMEMYKTLTAMKLVKKDSMPGKVFENLYIGSIGAAYNKEVLK